MIRTTSKVAFSRRKYGPELLVDAAMLSRLPAFTPTPRPHTLSFYDILLVTKGRGSFELDGERLSVAPGSLFFTAPGQIRQWHVEGLDGACVFFAADVGEAFADARFLDQFVCFDPRRPSGAITLTKTERTQFLRRFRRMNEEFSSPRSDATDLLRARLYEILVLLNRWYRARHPEAAASGRHPIITRFQLLIDRDFRRQHRVQDYARRLGVSPGHLSVLCHRQLGRSASGVIRQRLLIEAKRLLSYSDKPAFVVAGELGFADAGYFGRFFRRETGATPRRYRNRR
jgi:AraC-like DNA-binding protein